MFKEEVIHLKGLPIRIFSTKVKSEYYHWHDDLEIMLVLKGHITVTVGHMTYKLKESDLLVIDTEDIHKIKSIDEDNLVLFLHLNLDYFEHNYPNIAYMFFVCEAFNINSIMKQEIVKEKVEWLKYYMCQIMYESLKMKDGYIERIREVVNDCVFLLVDEFRTFTVDNSQLKDNKKVLKQKRNNDRVYRIIKYMYDNYGENITLEEVAKREYLSTYYVSHLIKEYMGLNFKKMLSFIRMEEAVKLLLFTDKTITEIALGTGFSKVGYFNKHFQEWYSCMPFDYRKREQNTSITRHEMKRHAAYEDAELMQLLMTYLGEVPEDNTKVQQEKRHQVIYIDALKTSLKKERLPQTIIIIQDIQRMMTFLIDDDLKRSLKEIHCNTLVLEKLWHIDDEGIINNWCDENSILNILEKCYQQGIYLIIQEKDCNKIAKSLSFIKERGYAHVFKNIKINGWGDSQSDINSLKDNLERLLGFMFSIEYVQILENQPTANKKQERHYVTDILYKILATRNKKVINVFNTVVDSFENSLKGLSQCIIFENGLKSPVYYMYYFLAHLLKGNVIQKGPGYYITNDQDNLNILLYWKKNKENDSQKKIVIKIQGLSGKYLYIRQKISDKNCYDYWKELGQPIPLKKIYCDLINTKTAPDTEFKIIDFSNEVQLQTDLLMHDIMLMTLEKVEN